MDLAALVVLVLQGLGVIIFVAFISAVIYTIGHAQGKMKGIKQGREEGVTVTLQELARQGHTALIPDLLDPNAPAAKPPKPKPAKPKEAK